MREPEISFPTWFWDYDNDGDEYPVLLQHPTVDLGGGKAPGHQHPR